MNATILDHGNDRPTVAIVDTVDELTPAWLTEALRQRATITSATRVESAHSTVIGTGQLGHVVRTVLTYAGDGQGPHSVVVKLPSEDAGSRGMGAAMGVYEAEVRFYQHIAPLIKARVPHLYSGAVDPETGRFTLVIEDLGPTAMPGDMIKGSTPEQTALAIDELVPLQAPIWNNPDTTRLPWLGVSRTEMLFAQVPHCVGPFRERFAGRLTPEHLALVEELAPLAPAVTETIWQPPFVVGHGDYRLDNMMFGSTPADPPIVLLDWQGARLAPPLLDAAVFLSACLTPEERRDHERDLLDRYHGRLVEAGVGDFTREHCWESYRACSLYPFLLTVAVSVTIAQTERGDAMWARMLGGAAELVLSTGAAKLVG
jgi:Phosphotransferase enzyme family